VKQEADMSLETSDTGIYKQVAGAIAEERTLWLPGKDSDSDSLVVELS
jgi:hypothetical protein